MGITEDRDLLSKYKRILGLESVLNWRSLLHIVYARLCEHQTLQITYAPGVLNSFTATIELEFNALTCPAVRTGQIPPKTIIATTPAGDLRSSKKDAAEAAAEIAVKALFDYAPAGMLKGSTHHLDCCPQWIKRFRDVALQNFPPVSEYLSDAGLGEGVPLSSVLYSPSLYKPSWPFNVEVFTAAMFERAGMSTNDICRGIPDLMELLQKRFAKYPFQAPYYQIQHVSGTRNTQPVFLAVMRFIPSPIAAADSPPTFGFGECRGCWASSKSSATRSAAFVALRMLYFKFLEVDYNYGTLVSTVGTAPYVPPIVAWQAAYSQEPLAVLAQVIPLPPVLQEANFGNTFHDEKSRDASFGSHFCKEDSLSSPSCQETPSSSSYKKELTSSPNSAQSYRAPSYTEVPSLSPHRDNTLSCKGESSSSSCPAPKTESVSVDTPELKKITGPPIKDRSGSALATSQSPEFSISEIFEALGTTSLKIPSQPPFGILMTLLTKSLGSPQKARAAVSDIITEAPFKAGFQCTLTLAPECGASAESDLSSDGFTVYESAILKSKKSAKDDAAQRCLCDILKKCGLLPKRNLAATVLKEA